MPTQSLVVTIVVVAVFAFFSVLLGWVSRRPH